MKQLEEEKNDVLVFSTDKFKETVRARYDTEFAEKLIENAKGWTDECEGLTPEQMKERYYVSSNAWLVKESELRRKK
jgi:hypothetical protein